MNAELEQLKQIIAEAQTRITKLEEAEKAAAWPKVDDVYYLITGYGRVVCAIWGNDNFDDDCLAIGSCFRTKEHAEKELEARKVIAELRRCEGARKFVVGECNYSIYTDLEHDTTATEYWARQPSGFGQVYFETDEQAEAAIHKVGADRIRAAARWLAMGE